jgi:hypothetical protein
MDFGFTDIIKEIVPDKRVRLMIYIIVILVLVAGASIAGYNFFVTGENDRIDHRIRPLKIKIYEGDAIQRHMFDHTESQLPANQRHNIDEIKRDARRQMLEDEKLEKDGE